MRDKADLLIVNSQILTMDPLNPKASNIAIKGNKIIEVGDFPADEYINKDTKIIDGDQKTVIPGFIDSHVHLFGGSAELSCLNVGDIQSIESLKRAVRDESARNTNDKLLYAVCAKLVVALGYTFLGDFLSCIYSIFDYKQTNYGNKNRNKIFHFQNLHSFGFL